MSFSEISVGPGDVALLGASGRFPGASNLEQLWDNVSRGVESIRSFTDEELRSSGVPEELLRHPSYVKARGVIDGVELFDAGFFGIPPREAEVMDPQHRLFLEKAWEALEDAGQDPARASGRIGVFAASGMSTYLLRNLYPNPDLLAAVDSFQLLLGNDKDFVPTRVSYKLGLRGPSVSVNTACSGSLVAVHLAYQSLLTEECDMALAGGVSVGVPQEEGYLYQAGGISSPDGHCRAFDAGAQGTVRGFGVGVVVLKRLADALADGDRIRAVLKGSAVNNDGSVKAGYTAPGADGQSEVIRDALALAGLEPRQISYIETHGTGTVLGDAIELQALRRVFGNDGSGPWCRLGSLKTNIGHLDAAAGVAGLIKTTLALEEEQIPPSLHFQNPNPELGLDGSPFEVASRPTPWTAGPTPRRAGVSAFGIGGTNAHVVVEEAPRRGPSGKARPVQLLTLSARSPAALEVMSENLAAYLDGQPETSAEQDLRYLADVAYTLGVGRREFPHRRVVVTHDRRHAAAVLRGAEGLLQGVSSGERGRPVAFLLPGQGAERVGMLRGLVTWEPDLLRWMEECLSHLEPAVAGEVRQLLSGSTTSELEQLIHRTEWAQPTLFVAEWALARWWMSRGVQPQALLGHSLGEYVAACLAGVFSLEDALGLVVARGRLMQGSAAGGMLSVALEEDELRCRLPREVEVAAVNAPERVTVSGSLEALEALARKLERDGVEVRRLPAERAFHSAAMEPILEAFCGEVERRRRREPEVPFVSNVTGDWISPRDATSADYWVRHLRSTVRFADGAARLAGQGERVLLEVGPGRTLTGFLRLAGTTEVVPALATARGRSGEEGDEDLVAVMEALGRLWLAGTEVDWPTVWGGEDRRRVGLPTYPFEHRRFWIDPPAARRPLVTAVPASEASTGFSAGLSAGSAWAVVEGLTRAAAVPVESLVRAVSAAGSPPRLALLGPPAEAEAPSPAPFPILIEELRNHLEAAEARAARDVEIAVPPPGVGECFDALCAHHICAYLEHCGVEITPGATASRGELLERLAILPKFHKFFDYLLGVLEQDGYLEGDGDRLRFLRSASTAEVEAAQRELIGRYPDFSGEAELLEHCVASYPRALTGEIDAVSVLFPGGSSAAMKPVQERSSRFSNFPRIRRMTAEVLGEMVRRAGRKRLRILEVGAGDGNLTWEVVRSLAGREVEYHFTDLGKSFVVAGERRARQLGYDFLHFGVLDIASDPEAQGYERHSFDLVLAFNVVHATPDIRETLGHLRRLLVPQGVMVLLEASDVPRSGTLIWGLAEGYWYFSDTDLRSRSPMLPPDRWEALLETLDFASHRVYPEDEEDRQHADTALIFAQEPLEPAARAHQLWLASRRQEIEEVRRRGVDRLRELGAEVTVVEHGNALGRGSGGLSGGGGGEEPPRDLATALAKARSDLGGLDGILFVEPVAAPWATTAERLAAWLRHLTEVNAALAAAPPRHALLLGPPLRASTLEALGTASYLETLAASCRQRTGVPWRLLRWEADDAVAGAELLRWAATPLSGESSAAPTDRDVAPSGVAPSHSRPELPTPYTAPRSETEERIAEIWQQAFGISPLGIHDSFFDLGGDSILVTQVLARVGDAFGTEVPVRDFYDRPTVAALAQILEGTAGEPAETDPSSSAPPLEPEIAAVPRASFRARRLSSGELVTGADRRPGEGEKGEPS